MKHSNNTHFVQLRAATAKNPVKVVGTVKEALDLVDQGNYIFPVQQVSPILCLIQHYRIH